jgi:hypothetical protein
MANPLTLGTLYKCQDSIETNEFSTCKKALCFDVSLLTSIRNDACREDSSIIIFSDIKRQVYHTYSINKSSSYLDGE